MRHYRKIILICFVGVALVVIIFFVPNRDGRDWAVVRVQSVKVSSNGYVTIQLKTHCSYGAGLECKYYDDGVETGGYKEGGGRRSFFPLDYGASSTGFNLNPEQVVITGSFTNSPLFARLLIHQGEVHRIYAGESLTLWDFTAECALALHEKHRMSCVYRVIPRNKTSNGGIPAAHP